MTITIEKKVLWLQVPVDDLVVVQVRDSKGNLSCIEFCSILSRQRMQTPKLLRSGPLTNSEKALLH